METLFPIESNYPEGFSYYPQFISIEEEKFLINLISGIELHNFQFHGYEAKRKVASFGYDYSFEKKALSKGKAIPGEFNFLIEKVCRQAGIKTTDIAELLVTEYPQVPLSTGTGMHPRLILLQEFHCTLIVSSN